MNNVAQLLLCSELIESSSSCDMHKKFSKNIGYERVGTDLKMRKYCRVFIFGIVALLRKDVRALVRKLQHSLADSLPSRQHAVGLGFISVHLRRGSRVTIET